MARIPRSTQLRHISKSCKFKYSMDNSNQNNKQDKNLKYTKFHSLILAYIYTHIHRFELNAPKHNEIQRCSLWHSVLHHLLTLDLKKKPIKCTYILVTLFSFRDTFTLWNDFIKKQKNYSKSHKSSGTKDETFAFICVAYVRRGFV